MHRAAIYGVLRNVTSDELLVLISKFLPQQTQESPGLNKFKFNIYRLMF